MARFIDAPAEVRCTATITLRDKSTAQCGRRAMHTGEMLCTQHYKLAHRSRFPGGMASRGVPAFNKANTDYVERSNAHPTETTHGLRPRDDHAWMMPVRED
jgi:hypothetical protein